MRTWYNPKAQRTGRRTQWYGSPKRSSELLAPSPILKMGEHPEHPHH